MAGLMRVRRGAVLLWRLGPLEYGDQSRWPHAPTSRGMCAFPWPFFDEWFTFHQYEYRMPRRLQISRRGWPVDRSWYVDADGQAPVEKPLDADGCVREGLELTDGVDDARQAWVRGTGRRVLPRRMFWYSGDLYTHLRPGGTVGSVGLLGTRPEWHRMDAAAFADAVASCGGNRMLTRAGGALRVARASVDHLEVFLPVGGGRVHGRVPEAAGRR